MKFCKVVDVDCVNVSNCGLERGYMHTNLHRKNTIIFLWGCSFVQSVIILHNSFLV